MVLFTAWIDHEAFWFILKITEVTGNLARWWLYLCKFYFYVVNWTAAKDQAADASFRLYTTRVYEFTLKDDDPVLTIIMEAQPEGNNIETDEQNRNIIPWNDGSYAIKQALPSHYRKKAGPKKSYSLLKDSSRQERGVTQGNCWFYKKSGPVYSCSRAGVLIRESRRDGEIQKTLSLWLH